MTERDRMVGELVAGIGGIDPVLDQAANYGKGVRAVQRVMHEQGQVMSAALANNHALYYTNKKLVARMRELDAETASLRRRFDILGEQNSRQAQYIEKLEAGGGDRFRALYEHARKTLELYLFDMVTQDEIRTRLGDMKAQAEEIDKMPDKATDEEIDAPGPDETLVGAGFEDL